MWQEQKDCFSIAEPADQKTKGLYLLFARGKRPDRAAVKRFAASQRAVSISHDPARDTTVPIEISKGNSLPARQIEEEEYSTVWLELLREGLAFDLDGLAPKEALAMPAIEHRFDLPSLPEAADYEVVNLAPGHHLAGGERTMPVAKGLIGLARDLVHSFEDLEAIIWPASKSAIGRRFFESVTTAWLDGGAFPALGLTAFEATPDGAMQSVGLDFWIGQELLIEPPLSSDKVAATRLGVRLVNQLIVVGGIKDSERIIAPDGTRLILRSSRNERFIRVSRE